MKNSFLFVLCTYVTMPFIYPQDTLDSHEHRQAIYDLVDSYSQARKTNDTVLLESILTAEVDQLVSSGTWRINKKESMEGMLRSSTNNPGTRTLQIERIRLINPETAIADARYQIENSEGKIRKMWSTFIVVYGEGRWKITGIRNMLPTRSQ
ncbi:DUF4440 domain-containing protein [Eudoraea chungangensis]|uniref:DUF4440 domain-containing protein n=1 Tax=Eudoraea chungangensis TaxID=1481905 RepID=UPI0023EB7C3C|nr:DUF4440 domain-containing protein [Eudoraea chungangensis]